MYKIWKPTFIGKYTAWLLGSMGIYILNMFEGDLLIGPRYRNSDVDVEGCQSQCDLRLPVHAKALFDDIIATLSR